MGIVDYGADHAGALTLNFEGLYYSGLPDRERLFAKLFEMETIVGAVFHGDSFLGKDTAGFGGFGAICQQS